VFLNLFDSELNINLACMVLAYGLLATTFIKRILSLKLHLTNAPSLKDVAYTGMYAVIAGYCDSSLIITSFWLVLILFLWCNAVLFSSYGLKINIGNVKTFFSGVKSFKGELAEICNFLWRFNWVLLCPLFFISCFFTTSSLSNSTFNFCSTALSLVLASFIFTKSKLRLLSGVLWLSGCTVVTVSLSRMDVYPYDLISIFIMSLVAIEFYRDGVSLAKFIEGRSVFESISSNSNIRYNSSFTDLKELEEIISGRNKEALLNPYGNLYGVLKDKSVFIFSVESLSYSAFMQSGVAKDILNIFTGSISTERAYAVSPNTNQSIRAVYSCMYNGELKAGGALSLLNQGGYNTVFITTQDTQYFNMNKLLVDSGFNTVIDNHNLPKNSNDYIIKEYVDNIKANVKDGKHFYHIMNSQTHSNYKVYDKEAFCEHDNSVLHGRYLNAVDESLSIIRDVILSLKKDGFFKDAVFILTGDHGQSFGEFGYHAHSSATINEQVRVPFIIFNDELPKINLDMFLNIDLMPSLFHLLGVYYSSDEIDGANVFTDRHTYTLLYSDTKNGEEPSNVSVVIGDKKYYVDNVFGERFILNLNDDVQKLDVKNENIENVVYLALKKHNFIG